MTLPPELLSVRSANNHYLDILDALGPWAEQAADVNRLVRPEYAAGLDRLRDQLRAARRSDMGTPASIARAVAELLGEA